MSGYIVGRPGITEVIPCNFCVRKGYEPIKIVSWHTQRPFEIKRQTLPNRATTLVGFSAKTPSKDRRASSMERVASCCMPEKR